ncbi:hypothetical protein KXQ82_00545 [Mucilaginibacter sp. HMF5004]|uniref:hypothetical protein n=1 Tax=Mucilaginibacter rivuli TaxID=2857527 RepID=UPI001C5F8D17|nr:hypothetical protein [Mucilaginibacter rivuli]MBW4888175.1 hypothetical protein [Mucilaginibacter rivuli]
MMMRSVLKFIALPLILSLLLISCCKKSNPSPDAPLSPTNQWARLTTIPGENISALEIINDVIYAGSATSRKVYMSADNGATWAVSAQIEPGIVSAIPDIHITALAVFGNKIYAGTDYNIYSSNDNGKTWADAGNPTEMVTSFATWNGNLYASSYRSGVLKLNTITNRWESFTNGITYPGFDNTATKVIATGTDIFAATAYSFATYSTAQQAWVRKAYYNHATYSTNTWWSDYTIDMVYNQGTLLGQVYMEYPTQQLIMRSDNQGTSWAADTLRLKTDITKYLMHGLLVGSSKYYSISNQDTIAVGTWIQQRDKAAPAGTTWANGEEFLPGISTAVIRENNGVLFLATNKGLYYRKS